MTNKILTTTAIITACIFVLCGCDLKTPTNEPLETIESVQLEEMCAEQNALHPIVADTLFQRITMYSGTTVFDANQVDLFRDTLTDIVYINKRNKHESTFTAMLKPDGKPMLYSEWVQLYEGNVNIDDIMVDPTENVSETIPEVTEEFTEPTYVEPTTETYAADYSIDLDEWEE